MANVNDGLKKVYNDKKQTTLKKVQDAIDAIQEMNKIVTKKELMEITGLSSGTFSQEYVKELLQRNRVCQYRGIKTEVIKGKISENKDVLIKQLTKKVESLESKIQDYDIALEKKSSELKSVQKQKEELEKEHILLRGKYQQVLEYLDVLGADMSKLPLV